LGREKREEILGLEWGTKGKGPKLGEDDDK